MEHRDSFRNWINEIVMWSMLTVLLPHQQAAAICLRLEGGAKEMVPNIAPVEVMNSGVVNGIELDPVSYMLVALHAFCPAWRRDTPVSTNRAVELYTSAKPEHQ